MKNQEQEPLVSIPKNILKKQLDRLNNLFADGQPKYIRCYYNENFNDSYTIVLTGNYGIYTGNVCWALGCSSNPFHPMGIGTTTESDFAIDKPTYSHLGKKIKWDDLPFKVQQYIVQNYLYIWDFTDESGKFLDKHLKK